MLPGQAAACQGDGPLTFTLKRSRLCLQLQTLSLRFYSSLKWWGPYFVLKVILNNVEFCLGFAYFFLCCENALPSTTTCPEGVCIFTSSCSSFVENSCRFTVYCEFTLFQLYPKQKSCEELQQTLRRLATWETIAALTSRRIFCSKVQTKSTTPKQLFLASDVQSNGRHPTVLHWPHWAAATKSNSCACWVPETHG